MQRRQVVRRLGEDGRLGGFLHVRSTSFVLQTSKGARSRVPLVERRRPQAYPRRPGASTAGLPDRGSGAAHAAENGERVARDGLPDELAAGLDLAVHALGERLGVLLRGGADDQVPPAALDAVALLLERLRERRGPRGATASATRTSHGA